MARPTTLLERVCAHVMDLGAQSFDTLREDGFLRGYAQVEGERCRILNFAGKGREAKELRADLAAATLKPARTWIGKKVVALTVQARSGDDVFEVSFEPAPRIDPNVAPKFTPRQGQYLAFISKYIRVHRQAPAESDLQRRFGVSAPSVHEMLKTLERNGLIERTPGQARSTRLLVNPEYLPRLG